MIENESQGLYETPAQAVQESNGEVRAWLQAIKLQKKEYKKWTEEAEEVEELYAGECEKRNSFNILYSNTQTIAPAVYNTPPLPDIRERYEESEAGRYIARLLERAVDFSMDMYDFHDTMKEVVKDCVVVGRGIPRVRYEPETTIDEITGEEIITYQAVSCELVDFNKIIIGPAKRWSKVPWIAFEHLMTREELKQLSPEYGDQINLDTTVNTDNDKEATEAPSLFKRALVYEVWDKETGEVLFISPSFKDDVLDRGGPDFNLSGFYPIPKPIYAIERTTSLIPTIPYKMYEEQAKELNIVTDRITALTKCLKWRGVYAKGFEVFSEIENLEDGEFSPTDQDFQIMAGMGLDKAVLFMPIGDLIAVIKELYIQREQNKQTIYEITGISDILRGSTKASETLGAQQLKAQWGSLRINDLQTEVQRLARDLIRMKCEIIAENYAPNVLEAITNMDVPEGILQIIRNDMTRSFAVDIETDSTIRADLGAEQKNVSQFVQGFGSFIREVGPAVQSGVMPKDVAVDLLLAFTRTFKLGRSAEAALERMKAPQQPQPQQGQAEAAKAQAEMQLDKYKIDKEAQTKMTVAQLDNQTELQKAQMDNQTDLQIESMKQQGFM